MDNRKLMEALCTRHFASLDEKIKSRLLKKALKFNDIIPVRCRKYGPYNKIKYVIVKLV